MPNIKSAKKRMQLASAAQQRNRAKRSTLRTAIKRVLKATDAKEAAESQRAAVKLIDRAATGRLVPPNRAGRIKSRLARHVASLS